MNVAVSELGITPETQLGLWRAAFRLRQAINELEHAAETIPGSSLDEHRCLEALEAARTALFHTKW